jgi:zinc/manganese transport system substrate-binding protein
VNAKLAGRLVSLAEKSKVPIVGVTETMPANMSYADWVLNQLDALDKALSNSGS